MIFCKVSNILSNSSYSIANNVISFLVSIITGMIIAKVLGPEGKGSFFLVSQIVSIGAVFFSLGVGPAILFSLKRGNLTKYESVSFSIIHTIIVVFLMVLFFVLFQEYVVSYLNNSISQNMLVLSIILISANILLGILGYVIMGDSEGVKLWSIISSGGNLLYALLLVILVLKMELGVIGALSSLLLALIVRLIILLRVVILQGLAFKLVPCFKLLHIYKYGFGIFIGNLFLTSVYRIDIFFVNSILSIKDLGIYSAAVNISELILLVPSALGVALFPHLSGLERREQIIAIGKIGRLSTLLALVSALGLALITYPFIIIVFGAKFKASFLPTLLLLPGLACMTLNIAYSNFLSSTGKPFKSAKIFTAGILVNVGLNLLFLKPLGIEGAAIFSSISYCMITGGFILVLVRDNVELKWQDIVVPRREDIIYMKEKIKNLLNLY